MEQHFEADPNLEVAPAYYSGGVPVFEPTMAQFQDFYKFNKAINKYGMQSGIAKIIPPKEWLSSLKNTYTADNLEKVLIKNPIVQNMNVTAGYKGVYSCQNVERQRKYTMDQWKKLSEKPNYLPPKERRRRAANKEVSTDENEPKDHVCASKQTRSKTSDSRPINKVLQKDFNIDVSQFTAERCAELERLYWKSLGYAEPMYGADVLGSLFSKETKSWNVAELPNVLDLMEEKLPGVNDAYLYAGLWKATFSWHLEDQDLYSINYLHFGAPKQWYSIPQSENQKFFKVMTEIFNEDYKNCSEFLRHKTFLASPSFLEKNGITCNKVIHNQGEFMITYPYGYHAGFNYGYNLAESVNFALDDWFEFAAKTKKCECIKDSVSINYRQIYCKFKGIPYIAASENNTHTPPKLQIPDTGGKKSLSPSAEARLKNEETSTLKSVGTSRKKRKVTYIKHECALCPNTLPEVLKSYRAFELLDTDMHNPKEDSVAQVHRICFEAFASQLQIQNRSGTDVVSGLEKISKTQRSFTCVVCHTPNRISGSTKAIYNGACLQCSTKKCARAYHATCALSAGFLFNKSCCKIHRSIVSKFYERDEAGLLSKLSTVPIDSMIQFALHGTGRRHVGEVFCGLVTKNYPDDLTFQVLVYPQLTESLEVQYNDVLLGSSSDLDNSMFVGLTKRNNTKNSPLQKEQILSISERETSRFPLAEYGFASSYSMQPNDQNYMLAGHNHAMDSLNTSIFTNQPMPNAASYYHPENFVFINEFASSHGTVTPQLAENMSHI